MCSFGLICQALPPKVKAEFKSGSETKLIAGTATDVPCIICSRNEKGEKTFQILMVSDPTFNVDFKFGDVEIIHILNHSTDNATKLLKIEHPRLSKLYILQFRTVGEKAEFISFYNN